MVRNVEIKTTIQDYKKDEVNEGKVAVYDIDNATVIYEGNEADWDDLEEIVEKANVYSEIYHMIIVPHTNKQIRSFSWR